MDNPIQNRKKLTLVTRASEKAILFEGMVPAQSMEFEKIHIDTNDDVENRIHDWLDKQNITITQPYDKVADYYHDQRIAAFNRGFEELGIRSKNDPVARASRGSPNLIMSSSPLIQRRVKRESRDGTHQVPCSTFMFEAQPALKETGLSLS